MKRDTCGGCRSYEAQTGEGIAAGAGACRCNPPTVQLVLTPTPPSVKNPRGGQALAVQAFFPPVRAEQDWCSQWQAAPATT